MQRELKLWEVNLNSHENSIKRFNIKGKKSLVKVKKNGKASGTEIFL